MIRVRRIFQGGAVVISLCLVAGFAIANTACDQAASLFQRAHIAASSKAEIQLLEQAVALCPAHAMAWNNLGLAYEKAERRDAAENAYRQAVRHESGFAAPYAGLGDLAMSQSRFREAATFYEQFLDLLPRERQKGDPMGLAAYEPEYRRKFEQAQLRWQIHQESMRGIVTQKTLSRGFRGIKKVKKTATAPLPPQRIALAILFDFDSAALKPQGMSQLLEVSRTLQMPEFVSERFMIEGHSDTIGDADYNLSLSRRRAESVRAYLTSQGIAADRLSVHANGESRPIVRTGDSDMQAVNRRVEFVILP